MAAAYTASLQLTDDKRFKRFTFGTRFVQRILEDRYSAIDKSVSMLRKFAKNEYTKPFEIEYFLLVQYADMRHP